ncbi:MAG: hypothetical protein AB7R67_20325 [Vicinamibacterales bacterium]
MESLGIAALIPLLIEWAKKSNLPFLGWVNQGTVLIARALSFVGAAATVAGLTWTYTDNVLTVANLTAWTALLFAWEVAKQLGLQEVIYRGAIKGK